MAKSGKEIERPTPASDEEFEKAGGGEVESRTGEEAEESRKSITIGDRTFSLAFPDAAPPLAEDTLQALRESIAEEGIKTPILVDEDDRVVDGHHRIAIASELDLPEGEVPVEVIDSGDEDLFPLAVELNSKRRSARSGARRREWVVRLREASERRYGEPYSNRKIAKLLGVSHSTINRDAKAIELEENEALQALEQVKSRCQRNITYAGKICEILSSMQGDGYSLGEIEGESLTVSLGREEGELQTAAEVLKELRQTLEKLRDRAKEGVNGENEGSEGDGSSSSAHTREVLQSLRSLTMNPTGN